MDDEVLEIRECFAQAQTEKALLIRLPDDEEVWIPQSQIHEDSEVYRKDDSGTLVITKFIATQRDLLDKGKLRYVGR